MNPLTVVTAFCKKDVELTKALYTWIAEMSIHDRFQYSCLLIADGSLTPEERKEISALAKRSFRFLGTIIVTPSAKHAPNQMFLEAANWMSQCCKTPWLWLEPDCVPLTPTWLAALADEYANSPSKFVGAQIKQDGQANLPAVHLTGCSIYPPDAYPAVYESISDRLISENVAWDMEAAAAVIPRSQHTELIHHFWGTPEMPPVFVSEREADHPKNFVTPDFVNKNAVLFHRSKDGNLIRLLRQKTSRIVVPTPKPAEPKPEPSPKPQPKPRKVEQPIPAATE